MNPKWLISLFFGFFMLLLIPKQAYGCDIEIKVIKGTKETYSIGDTIIVKVNVSLTHRSCPVKLRKTQFKLNGMKVLKATRWKKLSSMEYVRKLKIVITGSKENIVTISAIRECEKDGGFGSLKLKAVPKE